MDEQTAQHRTGKRRAYGKMKRCETKKIACPATEQQGAGNRHKESRRSHEERRTRCEDKQNEPPEKCHACARDHRIEPALLADDVVFDETWAALPQPRQELFGRARGSQSMRRAGSIKMEERWTSTESSALSSDRGGSANSWQAAKNSDRST